MELSNFIESFSTILEDTDPSTISGSTEFRSLEEWSSLFALSLIAMVDEEYQVKIKGDDIKSAVTIEDLYGVVKSRL